MKSNSEIIRRFARYMLEIQKEELANEICKAFSGGSGLSKLARISKMRYYKAAQAIIVMLRLRVERFGSETQDLYKEDEEALYSDD